MIIALTLVLAHLFTTYAIIYVIVLFYPPNESATRRSKAPRWWRNMVSVCQEYRCMALDKLEKMIGG